MIVIAYYQYPVSFLMIIRCRAKFFHPSMAEPSKDNDDAKMQKLQIDLDKMKKVAKKLLQQKNQYESKIKALQSDNESSQQNVADLQGQLQQALTIQAQLEEAIEKKNSIITSLEQKITHKVCQHVIIYYNNQCMIL